ncbi:MBL fold metallo-hydrolase [Herbiconiux liukaitaii]|uniref:MBL fold metallo-hydrolase n=1 Tax=Herbiconiux liukaitaii TaxID=3342799 RepID=UPI0035BA67A7
MSTNNGGEHEAKGGSSSRRSFLKIAGLSAAAAGVMALPAGAVALSQSTPPPRRASTTSGTRIVMLGTAGGPVNMGGPAGVSTAITVGERVFVVDLGFGSYRRLAESGIGGTTPLTNVAGILFTHLHSDHTADLPAVWATADVNNRNRTQAPIRMIGPGDRATLGSVFPPNRPEPALTSPEDPTPGIVKMTEHLTRAFAQDFNDRSRDSNTTPPAQLFEVGDIDLTGVWDVDPAGRPPRLLAPIPIWEDSDVRITATLVDHHPTAPAFAYRFDTPDGSVVISGDTTVSANLIDLAQDVDYLVHEVIDVQWVEALAATLAPEVRDAVRQHLIESHTTIEQVGRDVAEPANAKNLVLTHYAPDNPKERWQGAKKGYSGNLVVGEDLMKISVSPH